VFLSDDCNASLSGFCDDRFQALRHRDSGTAGGLSMSHPFWLDEERLNRIRHMFQRPRGVARSEDRKVLSGIIHVIRNGLRWRDAPAEYGPHKTLHNRWARWARMGIFARILTELASEGDATAALMIDATHPKTLRTASGMGLKKRGEAA